MLSAAFSQGNNQQRQMLAVVGLPLCATAGGAWISLANSDEPEPTAVVNMIHTRTPAGCSGEEKQKALCFLRRLGRTQCGVSNAQHLSTNKDFILRNLKHQQVCCPSQLQVSSSVGKVN